MPKHYGSCETTSNSLVFGKGNRKTAARTLLFSSGALSGRRCAKMRPGGVREKETLTVQSLFGEKRLQLMFIAVRLRFPILRFRPEILPRY